MKKLVDLFLSWPLPKSVCSDLCVTQHNYPHQRVGTNLLTAEEAGVMMNYLDVVEKSELDRERDLRVELQKALYELRAWGIKTHEMPGYSNVLRCAQDVLDKCRKQD